MSEVDRSHGQLLFGSPENRFVGIPFPTARIAYSNFSALVSERTLIGNAVRSSGAEAAAVPATVDG
jgi:hypothetical protein